MLKTKKFTKDLHNTSPLNLRGDAGLLKFLGVLPNKKPGISLLVAMIGSSIALGVATSIMVSLSQSVEQTQNIERSTQVFFAVESGLEAGFFHHNARGQGVDFNDLDSVSEYQIISHDNVNLDTQWTIKGRADSDTISGLLQEFTSLQLRWFWDPATSVEEDTSIVSYEPRFSITIEEVPGFDFGIPIGENESIVNWMITRQDPIDGINSLGPWSPTPATPCAPGGSFFCNNNQPFNLAYTLDGTLTPQIAGVTKMSVYDFIYDLDAENYQIVLSPLTRFTNTAGDTTIAGIPYTIVEGNNRLLPLPTYSVETRVQAFGFEKNLTLADIPEQSAISAFSYVIFD